ncbi:MAG: PDZ domain-containing protein [Nitrosomonadales bacterium]|nr:PDZ domain-containing protein [Nitrosomonadales bacterium]
MKKLFLVSAILLQTMLAGCATVDSSVWPGTNDPNEYYWHEPKRMASAEEAIGTIKNLQEYFVQWDGWTIQNLDIDKYGLRASGSWTEKNKEWVPSSGGFFAGSTYVPVYGGSVQTSSTQRQAAFSIPFDSLEMLRLAHFPTIPNKYKWGVIVKYKGEIPTLLLRVRSKDEAKRLIWALETLAAEHGYKFHADLGLFGSPLTAEQSSALGIAGGNGLLLTMVYKDGPGEKAGLRAGDVIIFIGKEPIRNGGSFSNAYAGKKVWQMFRREGGYGDYQLVSVKVDFPQVGGAPQTTQGVEDHWFMPTRMASAEQAIGVIKNLQQDIVGSSGWHIDDFEVDQFGMRAKGKDAMFIIPFDEISRMSLSHNTAQKDYKWELAVTFATERQQVQLRTTSEKIARRLGDAIGTLATAQGVRVQAGAGLRLRDSTAEDRESVDLEGEYGVTVFNVSTGGPAQKAGLKRKDIIVEVGGEQAAKTAEVITMILKAEAEAKPLMLKLLRPDGDLIHEIDVKLEFAAPSEEKPGTATTSQ